jgi:hypothetical protein
VPQLLVWQMEDLENTGETLCSDGICCELCVWLSSVCLAYDAECCLLLTHSLTATAEVRPPG